MSVPTVTTTPAPRYKEEELTPNAAAAFARTGRSQIEKLKNAGYLADLTMSSLIPLLEASHVACNGTVPLIQTAPSQESTEGWRPFFGDSVSLSDPEWILAQCGDWTGVSDGRVVLAKYALVGLGGVITGATKVMGVLDSGQPRKSRFDLELIGRLSGDLKSKDTSVSPTASKEEIDFAQSVLGQRYVPKAGGTVMWL